MGRAGIFALFVLLGCGGGASDSAAPAGAAAPAQSAQTPALSLLPLNPSVNKDQSLQFTTSGGVTPYMYSRTGVGSITAQGLFVSSVEGTATVTVTDAEGKQKSTLVTVRAPGTPFTPNDPMFSQQWGMLNIGAPMAWGSMSDPGNCSTVKVGIIDSGIFFHQGAAHPDLVANYPAGTNFWPAQGNPLRLDYSDQNPGYHGTHVAGIVGAVGNNALGVTGVCMKVNGYVMKVGATSFYGSAVTEAVMYAIDNGFKVLNGSFGGSSAGFLSEGLIQAFADAGGIFVAAAGNYNSNNDTTPFYPANHPASFSVMASNAQNQRESYSNYGRTKVHVAAPGSEHSTIGSASGPSYGGMGGTSMAAPHVAGAIALIWAKYPSWTRQQVINKLMSTCTPNADLADKNVCGGVINVGNALTQ